MAATLRIAGLLLLLVAAVLAQAPEGCGGFVSLASTEQGQDVTQVRVRLLTQGGGVVEETECAPNGYFFLPIYSPTASLVLQPLGPPGWSFEPASVQVAVQDGLCNGGADVQFRLAGLEVEGEVQLPPGCRPEALPLAGLEVVAEQEGREVARQPVVRSSSSLAYRIAALPCGEYQVRLAHPSWAAGPPGVLQVAWSGVRAPALRMAAYALPVRVLHASHAPAAAVRVVATPATDANGANDANGATDAVEAVTDDAGWAVVRAEACGLVRLDVHADDGLARAVEAEVQAPTAPSPASPSLLLAAVPLHGLLADVHGAPTSGTVRAEPLVALEAQDAHLAALEADAGPDGAFRLLVPAGEVLLAASAPGMQFGDVQAHAGGHVQVRASHVLLCGRLEGEGGAHRTLELQGDVGDASATLLPARPAWSPALGPSQASVTDGAGAFCLWVGASGSVGVQASGEDERVGGWAPARIGLTHASAPPAFRLAAFRIAGRLLLDPSVACAGLEVVLDGGRAAVVGEDCAYALQAVLPGPHRLHVAAPHLCWPHDHLSVTVEDADVQLDLEASGFAVEVEAPLAMGLVLQHSSGWQVEAEVGAGRSRVCVERAGSYEVQAQPPLRLAAPLRHSTAAPAPLAPVVAQVLVQGVVRLAPALAPAQAAAALRLALVQAGQEQEVEVEAGPEGLQWHAWARAGVEASVACVSQALVCEPASASLLPSASRLAAPGLEAHAGHFLEGVVAPAMAGVEVVVRGPDGAALLSAVSDASGRYRAGPLRSAADTTASAHKDGFHFSPCPAGFRAVRLGDVRVQVEGEAGPLPGVLLSLTGAASFRANTQSHADGSALLAELFPGAYHLKPLLKEYVFEPASLTVDVVEGVESQARFVARRVAFSAYGSVRSLAGSPEKVVTVVATSSDGLAEEAQTDAEGNFRIRGLRPGLQYEVRAGRQARVAHVSPAAHAVQVRDADLHGLHFTALRPHAKLLVSGSVASAHLASHTVVLEKANGEEVARQELGVSPHFVFTDVAKGEYRVRLLTSLEPLAYDFSLPEAALAFDGSGTAHASLAFEATPRTPTAELSNSSFLLLLLLSAAAVALYYRKHTVALAQDLIYGRKAKSVASADDYLPAHLTSKKRKKNK